jgi:hypothetical protein
MSTPELYGRDLVRLINQVVDQRLSEGFGGSPGVYTNVNLTIDRTGRTRFAQGGGEVGVNFDGQSGVITYVAPYAMTFGTVVEHSSGGAVSFSYASPGSSSFGGTSFPIAMEKGGALRITAAGVGTADYYALTLVRLAPGGTA